MRVQVCNWRCIENVELELSRLNLFIGRNGTGKSSLAYAIYFLSKVSKRDPNAVAMNLYGLKLDEVARRGKEGAYWPITIKVDSKVEFTAESAETVSRPKESSWSDEYLLPSRRLAYVQAAVLLEKLWREMKPEDRAGLPFLASLLKPVFEHLPLFSPAPAFLEDFARATTGASVPPVLGESAETGSYRIAPISLLTMLTFTYRDKYTGAEFPLDYAPDGQVDNSIIDVIITRAPKGSLIVIEEPDTCKNPLAQIELVNSIATKATEREHTVIMTTHSEVVPIALAKLVGEHKLKVRDVRIYYFTRDPWTKVRSIRVYSDGTLGELPDSEKVTVQLF